MSGGWGTLRTIVLERDAQEQFDKFEEELARFDDAWKGLEWLICRKPDIGRTKRVGETIYNLYKQDSDAFAITPVIVILYSFDAETVIIIEIKAYEADKTRQGTA